MRVFNTIYIMMKSRFVVAYKMCNQWVSQNTLRNTCWKDCELFRTRLCILRTVGTPFLQILI